MRYDLWMYVHECTCQLYFSCFTTNFPQTTHFLGKKQYKHKKRRLLSFCCRFFLVELVQFLCDRWVTPRKHFLSSPPNHHHSFQIIIISSESSSFLPNHLCRSSTRNFNTKFCTTMDTSAVIQLGVTLACYSCIHLSIISFLPNIRFVISTHGSNFRSQLILI